MASLDNKILQQVKSGKEDVLHPNKKEYNKKVIKEYPESVAIAVKSYEDATGKTAIKERKAAKAAKMREYEENKKRASKRAKANKDYKKAQEIAKQAEYESLVNER